MVIYGGRIQRVGTRALNSLFGRMIFSPFIGGPLLPFLFPMNAEIFTTGNKTHGLSDPVYFR